MSISIEETKKMANLAKLRLKTEEEQKYAHQLSAVLDYVDQLKDLEIKKVEPVRPFVHTLAELRADEQDGGRHQSKILENAPQKKDNLLSVPAVFEE